MSQENEVLVVEPQNATPEGTVANITQRGDDLIILAEQAEQKVAALKKVMTACLSVTSPFDWVLIGGKPYLQESGCTKIANLIGVSFEIAPGFPVIETDSKGYKTYTYRVRAFAKNTYVEGEGSRSMKEDFFSKSKDGMKLPEEIKDRDVRVAALTNAKANAIKSIIPGLKNMEINTLKEAGIKIESINGYAFKTGSKGGKSGNEEEFVCEGCGKKVNGQIASYSQGHFSGHIYCLDCQVKAAKTKQKYTGEVTPPYSDDKFESVE